MTTGGGGSSVMSSRVSSPACPAVPVSRCSPGWRSWAGSPRAGRTSSRGSPRAARTHYTITGAAAGAARLQLAALSEQYRPPAARSAPPAGRYRVISPAVGRARRRRRLRLGGHRRHGERGSPRPLGPRAARHSATGGPPPRPGRSRSYLRRGVAAGAERHPAGRRGPAGHSPVPRHAVRSRHPPDGPPDHPGPAPGGAHCRGRAGGASARRMPPGGGLFPVRRTVRHLVLVPSSVSFARYSGHNEAGVAGVDKRLILRSRPHGRQVGLWEYGRGSSRRATSPNSYPVRRWPRRPA